MGDWNPEDVACPYCLVESGERCQTIGRETPRAPHNERVDAAKQAAKVGRDPMEAKCSHCHAYPGHPCQTSSGRDTGHHAVRGQRSTQEGLL